MNDWKPYRNPGYTGDRHDDRPEKLSRDQAGVLGFIVGLLFCMTIDLFFTGMTGG